MADLAPREQERSALDALLAPRSIAVLGASSDTAKIGGVPIALLKKAGFRGDIIPVNPKSDTIQGLAAVPTLSAAGRPVDLAVISLPAKLVEGAVDDCIAAGVRAIVIFSAGLGEIDEAGKALEARIAARCRAAGVRLVGPNALGVFSPLTATFATFSTALHATWPEPGVIAIASQSGAVGSYCYAMLADRGIGISHFAATGNEADVTVADLIAHFSHDPATSVIVAYVEGIKDGPAFVAALKTARAAGKPVVVMKVGRSDLGAEAVASHTGALAGAARGADAVMAAAGAYAATSMDDLVDAAEAAATGVFARGRRVGVITLSGGVGVLMADLAANEGLTFPPLPDKAQAAVKAIVPFASGRNPVDVTAQVITDITRVADIAEIAIDGGGFDTVILFLAHMARNLGVMDQLIPALAALRRRHPDVPFIVCARHTPEVRDRFRAEGFLVNDEPRRAVRLAGLLAELGRAPAPAGEVPADAVVRLPSGSLDEVAARQILAAAGIAFPPSATVRTAQEAGAAAAHMGGAVALKIISPDIAHKSDVGGVRLDVAGAEAVETAAREMAEEVARKAPDARQDGFLVTPMLTGGVECVIGSVTDPVFGPLVMLGLGGVLVEVLRDVVFRPAPVSPETAEEMIGALKASALLLESVRGRPAIDRDALVATIVRVSQIAAANRDAIAEMEINPYLALPGGGYALDALIVPHARPVEP
ncbi:acetate--CoA ligase family protein [Acuticoccus mangrovi]|uniref:Acetate--CoA ligase family protein n=1 Tax=Acuticoccus mangrovi TaxID=2796142 RepID=A0A934IQX2_9HYPH|nr:acetate--CoA ligase family protein [Acuticoccus mangrovi]MBJ3777035.1 acetate--CoA ligase family protein [Acuticoccus mangrovi]